MALWELLGNSLEMCVGTVEKDTAYGDLVLLSARG